MGTQEMQKKWPTIGPISATIGQNWQKLAKKIPQKWPQISRKCGGDMQCSGLGGTVDWGEGTRGLGGLWTGGTVDWHLIKGIKGTSLKALKAPH